MYIESLLDNKDLFARLIDLMIREREKQSIDHFGADSQQFSIFPIMGSSEGSKIVASYVNKHESVFSKVKTPNLGEFFVNDYNLFANVGGLAIDVSLPLNEEANLDRYYTKYMMWAYFDQWQEYSRDFIQNQLIQYRPRMRKLSEEKRKEQRATIEQKSTDYMRVLAKEIIDDYMFAKFFGHLVRFDNKSESFVFDIGAEGRLWDIDNEKNFKILHNVMYNGRCKKSVKEMIFYDRHKDYFVDLVMRKFGEYNLECCRANRLSKLTEQKAKEIVESHDFSIIAQSDKIRNEKIKGMLFDSIVPGLAMDELTGIPFAFYQDAYQTIYNNDTKDVQEKA